MNSAKTLYSILTILISLIVLSISIGFIISILVFSGAMEGTVTFQPGFEAYKTDVVLYLFMALILIIYVIFIAGLLKLRQATKLLLNQKFYTSKLIHTTIFSGKCLVIVGIFSWLIDGLSSMYFEDVISISISEKTFIYLFITAMGLFLMLMGDVIKSAKTIKEENELTI